MEKNSTGSHTLRRQYLFNPNQQDIDIPDGDVRIGQQAYKDHCLSCHSLDLNYMAPRLRNIYGKMAGTQKGFNYYSKRNRGLGYRWSKYKIFILLQNPEKVLGIDSGMTFAGLRDNYQRACLIQYLHFVRLNSQSDPPVSKEWFF